MNRVSLVMIVHDHQPVGNFDGVFRAAYDDAYAPFLGFLERHPKFRIALHTSGPLLDWIAAHEPSYLARLRALVGRGQIEPWGGGLYEPILSSIAEPDRHGQILAMAERLERDLGRRPTGLWLTERVWEPGLAASLFSGGVEYTAVDDAHFVAAGLERDQLWGRFTTEDQGQDLGMFPIHRELRYSIPFSEPEVTIGILRRVAEGGADRMVVLGDDGEKFGVWPGTHKHCYVDGWLERFAAALAAEDWIDVLTPAEAFEHHPSRGLVYLPTASYHEMQEWALPPAAQLRYHAAAERLEPVMGEASLDLLRGGHWRAFLARYPEANRIHKRALRASRRLWGDEERRQDDPQWREAIDHLWRAQCNDAYWHGVFGGLYLPHLRSALYRELIAAERGANDPLRDRSVEDVDLDGHQDSVLEEAGSAAWISTRGARLWAFDDRVGLLNYCDTLARRPEAYHDPLREAAVGGGHGQSIHSAVRWKEPGHEHLLGRYDAHERDSFLDRWFEPGVEHDWAEESFHAKPGGLECAEGRAPQLEKGYTLDESGLHVTYRLGSQRARRGTLEITVNLGLHVFRADDRWVEIDGRRAEPSHWGASAAHEDARRIAFVDGWADRRLEIALSSDAPVPCSREPIEAISLSEAGAEAIFQGVEVRWRFAVALEAGTPWRTGFTLRALRAAEVPA
jgi:alpha-amylase